VAEMIRIQFYEKGTAENPFTTRFWSFVPCVGESVVLSETGGVYDVTGVQWLQARREDGNYEEEPMVLITVERQVGPLRDAPPA